jgi:hypothetical protein
MKRFRGSLHYSDGERTIRFHQLPILTFVVLPCAFHR